MTLSIMGRPWDVYLATNQLANRAVMDTFGTGGKVAVSRNNHERIEHLLGVGIYWLSALILPTILEFFISRRAAKTLKTANAKGGNPLKMPFELLERNRAEKLINQPSHTTLQKLGVSLEEWQKVYGLNKVSDFTPQLAKKLLQFKLAVMVVDFAFVGLKGNFR